MELLVTLKNIDYIKRFKDYGVFGVIAGTPVFSSRYMFDLEDLKIIKDECERYNLDMYISIDTMIEEKERALLYEYLEFIKELDVKGIYFTDLAVLKVAKDLKLESKLIYDPSTLITNSLDAYFYLSQGIDSVMAAREITLDEITEISKNNNCNIDMQIFGYVKTAMSKRHFLSNYFKHLGQNYNVLNKESLKIVEESRDYEMPITETKYGTNIYTDYILCTYEEYHYLRHYIKRAIIDDIFIREDMLFDVLKDYQRCNDDNASLLLNNLKLKYYKYTFDKGYLYQKTNLTK
ncbi:MAG: peptidase U32 family protein [Erysipelotrichaceae bacterium]